MSHEIYLEEVELSSRARLAVDHRSEAPIPKSWHQVNQEEKSNEVFKTSTRFAASGIDICLIQSSDLFKLGQGTSAHEDKKNFVVCPKQDK
jgi:hypothetical protein